MISQFRATGPADAGAISLLMQQVFGMTPDDAVIDAQQMDWKYWRAHPGWEGSRSFVMEREGEVTAHGAVVPLTCVWGDRRLRMVHLIDWAARRNSTGAGIALLKRIGQMVDGIFIAGGSETALKILPALGFREIGKATRFALPLCPLAKLLDDSFGSWRPFARFARNLFWNLFWKMMRSSSRISPGWRVRKLSAGELAGVQFPARKTLFERTVPEIAFFLACPAAPAEFYLVERDGAPRGYFVLSMAVNQCRIAEAWIESDDWRTLYMLAIREAAANRNIFEIATAANNEMEIQALKEVGFKIRGQIPLLLWTPGGSGPDSIRYQLVDGDAAYLHDGRNAFWT